MISEKNSILYKKTFNFALDIINLYKYLIYTKKEFILSKQLLRSGTSIGANVSESFNSQSHKDFISKLHISLKEASETNYWLDLLKASNIINEKTHKSFSNNLTEIIKISSKIIKNTKLNHNL